MYSSVLRTVRSRLDLGVSLQVVLESGYFIVYVSLGENIAVLTKKGPRALREWKLLDLGLREPSETIRVVLRSLNQAFISETITSIVAKYT